MNPELKAEVEGLQSTMFECATKELPTGYTVVDVPGTPLALITDLVTGKELKIGLCDLYGALTALRKFAWTRPNIWNV